MRSSSSWNGRSSPWPVTALNAVVTAGPEKAKPADVARLRSFYLAYIARPVTDELAARQAAWALSGSPQPPAWKPPTATEYTADAVPGVL